MTTVYSTRRSTTQASRQHMKHRSVYTIDNYNLFNEYLQLPYDHQSTTEHQSMNIKQNQQNNKENCNINVGQSRSNHVHSSSSSTTAAAAATSTATTGTSTAATSLTDTHELIDKIKQQIQQSKQTRKSSISHNRITKSNDNNNKLTRSTALPTRTLNPSTVTKSTDNDTSKHSIQHKHEAPSLLRARSTVIKQVNDDVSSGGSTDTGTTSTGSSTMQSNLDRFYADEYQRKQYAAAQLYGNKLHTRHDIYTKQWNPPVSTTDAQTMWLHMHQQINSSYNSMNNNVDSGHLNTASNDKRSVSEPVRIDSPHTVKSTPTTSSQQSTPSTQYKSMTVQQLKYELQQRNISCDGCVEKYELIKRLVTGNVTPRLHRYNSKSVDMTHQLQQQQIIIDDITKWANKCNHDICVMLNQLNINSSVNDQLALRYSTLDDIQRIYKRVLLRHHPDKHVNDSMTEQIRATETIKQLNHAMSLYKTNKQTRLI